MSQYYKVVITGATGGIGREIVKRLDKKSELIILVGLTKNSLDDLKVINPLKSHLDLFPNVRVLFSSKSLKNIRFNINYLQ